MLLLAPGGGALEFDLEGCGGGQRELALKVMLLAAEDSVEMGGRVLVDGAEVGQITPFSTDGSDEIREICLNIDIAPNAQRLRIECALFEGGPEAHLRLVSLEIRAARVRQAEEVAS